MYTKFFGGLHAKKGSNQVDNYAPGICEGECLIKGSVFKKNNVHSLKLTAKAPENRPSQKETIVF